MRDDAQQEHSPCLGTPPHSSANKENDPQTSGSLTSQCRSVLCSPCCTRWPFYWSPHLPICYESNNHAACLSTATKSLFAPRPFSRIIHISILQGKAVYIWSKYCLSETYMSVYSHGPMHHHPTEIRSGFLSGRLVQRPPTTLWRWSRHQHIVLPRLPVENLHGDTILSSIRLSLLLNRSTDGQRRKRRSRLSLRWLWPRQLPKRTRKSSHYFVQQLFKQMQSQDPDSAWQQSSTVPLTSVLLTLSVQQLLGLSHSSFLFLHPFTPKLVCYSPIHSDYYYCSSLLLLFPITIPIAPLVERLQQPSENHVIYSHDWSVLLQPGEPVSRCTVHQSKLWSRVWLTEEFPPTLTRFKHKQWIALALPSHERWDERVKPEKVTNQTSQTHSAAPRDPTSLNTLTCRDS